MDNRQAKRILALYRPDVADPDDSQMAEALEMVQRDPELAAWFERQSAVNEALRARLKAIPVPADLKRRILANHAARARVIPFPKPVMIALSAAAAVAIMFFVWQALKSESSNNFEHYRDRMARMVQRSYAPMDFVSTNQATIREWLGTRNISTNYTLPAALENLAGEGAAIIPWQNHRVCMLCLSNGTAGLDVWVFIAELKDIPHAPKAGKPTLATIGNFMTASWTAGDKLYLVTGADAVMRDYAR